MEKIGSGLLTLKNEEFLNTLPQKVYWVGNDLRLKLT